MANNVCELKTKDKATFYSPYRSMGNAWYVDRVAVVPEHRRFTRVSISIAWQTCCGHAATEFNVPGGQTSQDPSEMPFFTCEWAHGQKPQLTRNGKIIVCTAENFVPVAVPGLSSSSSTSFPQDSSSTSSSPAKMRSDEGVSGHGRDSPKKPNQNKNKDNQGQHSSFVPFLRMKEHGRLVMPIHQTEETWQ